MRDMSLTSTPRAMIIPKPYVCYLEYSFGNGTRIIDGPVFLDWR